MVNVGHIQCGNLVQWHYMYYPVNVGNIMLALVMSMWAVLTVGGLEQRLRTEGGLIKYCGPCSERQFGSKTLE